MEIIGYGWKRGIQRENADFGWMEKKVKGELGNEITLSATEWAM